MSHRAPVHVYLLACPPDQVLTTTMILFRRFQLIATQDLYDLVEARLGPADEPAGLDGDTTLVLGAISYFTEGEGNPLGAGLEIAMQLLESAPGVAFWVWQDPFEEYPGGDPSGCAAVHLVAHTRKEALALAGLLRVRGRCIGCGASRPLHVERWRPDSGIPCPGCGAGWVCAVTLRCRGCHQPIVPNKDPGVGMVRSAWCHTGSTPYCDVEHHGFATDASRARPGG
ncbi:MAG: hypothetical protein ACRDRO_04020 [Pseudonocardiaceae bacterium]